MIERTNAARQAMAGPLLVPMIAASQFAPPFMISGVAVALPAIGTDLGAGATSLGLVESLFLAGSVAFLLPAGRLADAGDKRSLYKLGLLAFAASSLLLGLVSSVPLILFLRFVQGAISALVAVSAPALLTDLVPPERRGRAFGGMIGSIYAGLTLGPICAGFLIELWGWRAVFLAGGGALVLVYSLTQAVLPSSWRRPALRAVHGPSTLLVSAAALLLVLGAASLGAGWPGYAILAAGIVAAVLFIAWQRPLEQPLLDLELLTRNATLRNALLAQSLLYTNAFCSVFLLSIYMQVVLGRSANTSGQVLAVGTVLMAAVAPVAGLLADRYRAQLVAGCGVAVVLLCPLLALALDARSALAHVAALLAVQGVGFALFSTPNMKIAINSVPASYASLASALSGTARSLGMLAGMFIAAVLVSLNLGNEPVHRDPARFLDIMQGAFLVLAVLTLVALAVSFARPQSQ
jgi:MFS family permease